MMTIISIRFEDPFSEKALHPPYTDCSAVKRGRKEWRHHFGKRCVRRLRRRRCCLCSSWVECRRRFTLRRL